MASPDLFDDDFFVDPEALDAIAAVEAQALSASQLPKAKITHPYHHTVSAPKAGPSKLSGSGVKSKAKVKDPVPLNTEPRVSNGGFGWGEGGKHFHTENVQRIIAATKQQQYRDNYSDDDPPDLVINASGRYDFGGPDENVVDKHAQAVSESLAVQPRRRASVDPTGAAARREAIRAAILQEKERSSDSRSTPATSNSFGPSAVLRPPPSLAPLHPQAQSGLSRFGATRSLSRSASAGSQILARPAAAAVPPGLDAIPSHSVQQGQNPVYQHLPASQGSLIRKSALELEAERRKREELERQLADLKAQLDEGKDKEKARVPWAEKLELDIGHGTEAELTAKVKLLQTEIWRAKGEIESVRRAQRDENQKHLSEAEKLRGQLADMHKQLKERENDSARQMETLRTQAVFNNHAVYNSAVKARQILSSQRPQAGALSQRPLPTPTRNGSPSRKGSVGNERDTTPLMQSVKGKGKALPQGAAFKGLVNAFDTETPGRGKRLRTQAPSPNASPSKVMAYRNGQRTPTASPSKADDGLAGPAYDLKALGDDPMAWEHPVFEGTEPAAVAEVPDLRAEFLYHLLNHVSTSPLQVAQGFTTQPTIYRILDYRPSTHSDPQGLYILGFAEILRACGDPQSDVDALMGVVGRALTEMVDVVLNALQDPQELEATVREVIVMVNILSLLSSTGFLFPSFVKVVASLDLGLGRLCKAIATTTFDVSRDKIGTALEASLREATDVGDSVDMGTLPWEVEMADALVSFAESLCWFGDGRVVWKGDELVDTILSLTSTTLDVRIVRRGIDLFHIATCYATNFRNLVGPSDRFAGESEQPVVDRMARYLLAPHPAAGPKELLQMSTSIVRGFCMLSVADFDAVLLTAERSLLVPALVIVLHRESSKIWGIHVERHSFPDAFALIYPSLLLLHHLVFPAPFVRPVTGAPGQSSSQLAPPMLGEGPDPEPDAGMIPQGIHLPTRLHAAAQTKEFNGLHHVFQAAMGAMAYADVDVEMEEVAWSVVSKGNGKKPDQLDLRSVQYLSQDLLEATVEGPEQDAIYEVYAGEDEQMDEEGKEDLDVEGVDPQAYAEMEVEQDEVGEQ